MHTIRAMLQRGGTLSLADFIALAGCQYYDKRSFVGDFITSPELTPMFGYTIAAELAKVYNSSFYGRKICLIELGPGSGKMMSDILHFLSRNAPDMLELTAVYMVENSDALQSAQKENLSYYTNISWVKCLPCTEGAPMFVVANEFFDALPAYKYIMTENGMKEIRIALQDDELVEVVTDVIYGHALYLCDCAMQVGNILEISVASDSIMRAIAHDMQQVGGLGLFFDYGYIKNKFVSTIRAIKEHRLVDYLNTPAADISMEVNFGMLARAAKAYVSQVRIRHQRSFLNDYGIFNITRDNNDSGLGVALNVLESMRTFKVLRISS